MLLVRKSSCCTVQLFSDLKFIYVAVIRTKVALCRPIAALHKLFRVCNHYKHAGHETGRREKRGDRADEIF